MIFILLFYFSVLISLISLGFLIVGFRTKKYKTKVISSYILGASTLTVGLLTQNPSTAWVISIIGVIFLIAPNNMHEIDFKKNGS